MGTGDLSTMDGTARGGGDRKKERGRTEASGQTEAEEGTARPTW